MKNQFFLKVKLILAFLLFQKLAVFSQDIPTIKADNSALGLQQLNIKVDVIGNIATTTYDMVFYNPKNRILEGELSFPLGESQKVNRFALELNGKLREAVVVEKELGRVAFESTIRRKIDPALLEQTKGNNYKARIYPIPAKGTKRVVLSFQQELHQLNNTHNYFLPLNFKEQLNEFNFEMVVYNQEEIPVETNQNLVFNKWQKNYKLSISKKNYKANKDLKIKIPVSIEKEKLITAKSYFYLYKNIEKQLRLKEKPTNIVILWDVSLSMKNRKLDQEINLLKDYLSSVNNVAITIKKFSNKIISERQFQITNGDTKELIEYLKNSNYDGATSYNKILNFKNNYSECLLFTDGMDNFGALKTYNNTPIYTINSIAVANHIILKKTATNSGGNYINLNYLNKNKALDKLRNQTYLFLGVDKSNSEIEIYPNSPIVVTSDFSISGRDYKENDEVTLLFGYGNKVTNRLKIKLVNNYNDQNQLEQLWAQKRLASLLIEKDKNKKEIIKFSKNHQLISPFTSLIVLDRIEDYVKYEIEPPKELKETYKRLVTAKNAKKDDNSWLFKGIQNQYNDIKNWWKRDFIIAVVKPKKDIESVNENSIRINTQNQNIHVVNNVNPNLRTISGVVSDEMGPVADISVKVKGTNRGAVTNFDGEYQINADAGDILEFSHVSYASIEKTVSSANRVDVFVNESGDTLDEVIVTAMGVRKEKKVVSYSVSVISSEELKETESSINDSLEKTLQGTIAGVNVQSGNGVSGASNEVRIRGLSSMKNNSNKDIIFSKLKSWNANMPYIKQIHQGNTLSEKYSIYLKLRNDYANQPTFYLDVADYFIEKGYKNIAIRVLSNIAEIDLENYELLRALAYKLEALNHNDDAVFVYKEILKIRPEDIQSYRDLALAYQSIGEYQKALDLFYKIVSGDLLIKDKDRRFKGIEQIAFVEMNNLISKYKKELNLEKIDKKYISKINLDFRIVIDWNHNDTDIDLWIVDPNGEKCYYSHKKTKIGGKISNDMTNGFGPEEFMLKKAIEGNYDLTAHYFSDSMQKISGPTILKVSVFKNYGSKNEQKTVKVIRLDKNKDKIDLGKMQF